MQPNRPRLAVFALVPLAVLPAAAQTTTFVSPALGASGGNGWSWQPSVSDDGRFVAFESSATDLVAGDTNNCADVFVRDVQLGTTVRISVDASGANADNASYHALISGDGRYVAFESVATDLVAGDTNDLRDVFVRDLLAGSTVRASVSSAGAQGSQPSYLGSLSTDGRFAGFASRSNNFVAGDTSGLDVFVRDLQTSQTTRASLTAAGNQANGESDGGSVSADGRYVAFRSFATNLVAGDTNGIPDIFVRDMSAGTTILVTQSLGGSPLDGAPINALLSADGRFVAYASDAGNIVPGDTNGTTDVFEYDTLTGQTRRASVNSLGTQATAGAYLYGISGDGRFVVMASLASTLAPGDTNNVFDIFVNDRATGSTSRASLGNGQVQGNGSAEYAGISGDGRFVVFSTTATNLDPNDPSSQSDVYLRDRGSANTVAFCFGDGTQATPCPCSNGGVAGRGCENSSLSGGAQLGIHAFGSDPDSATLTALGIVPGALTIFLQGDAQIAGASFGDGVRCVGGALKRMYAASAAGGTADAPPAGSLPLGSRSDALGNPIASGSSRWYQAWYRDSDPSFCAAPAGDAWNVSNGVRVDW